MDLDTIFKYLRKELFIKIDNVAEFPELGEEEKYILQHFGLPTNKWGIIPTIISDGKLKRYSKDLIELGLDSVGSKFLLNTISKQVLLEDEDESELIPVNSSLKKLMACKYAMKWYEYEIESKQKFGRYFSNPKKYAEVLRAMLMEADPGIEHYAFWQEILLEKELGVH